MKRLCVLAIVGWLAVAGSAQAQFWNPFRKAPPPAPPAERVGLLITMVKSDPDERKRSQAVEALREFDIKAFPEIVPVLADVAQNDPKAGVRADAISSLVRIRPVTPTAGQAIEHAAAKDDNWRNRMNAQAALVRYRLAGYSSTMPNPADPKTPPQPHATAQSKEPPLGDRPPVIYYDQHGKVIPRPKDMPPLPPVQAPGVPNPVNGVPVSNPTAKTPFAPIGPSVTPSPITPAPVAPLPPPNITPALPSTPLPQASVPVEPVFRNVNTLPKATTGTPTSSPTPAPGPSLDLPPLPINNGPAPTIAPPSVPLPTTPAPVQGPSLESSTSGSSPANVAPAPSGRMEPSPRLQPVD